MLTRFPTRALKRLKAARPLAETSVTSRPRPQQASCPRHGPAVVTVAHYRDSIAPVTSAPFPFKVLPGIRFSVLRVYLGIFLRDEAEFTMDL